jgi:hypothetical protein
MSGFQPVKRVPFRSGEKILPLSKDSTKNTFEIDRKTATIWRKEHLIRIPTAMATVCKHPRVRIVSRQEDTEFVECLECGEVFDSEEFRDMEIEETAETEEVSDDL